MASVPAELTGLWRREVITTPSGYRDDTTAVLWLQTLSWYADLRVRADRPSRPGAQSFQDYSDDELLALAAVQGFAGQLTAADGVCLWRRDLDYQPPNASPDEARFAVDGEVMIEDGIHADYQEIWRREALSLQPLMAFDLAEDTVSPGRAGLLVVAGDHFIELVDRPTPLPADESLADVVKTALAAGRRDEAIAALSMRICQGRIDDGRWTIALSSFPWLEGASLWADEVIEFDAEQGLVRRQDVNGRQTWRLIETSAAATDLAWSMKASV